MALILGLLDLLGDAHTGDGAIGIGMDPAPVLGVPTHKKVLPHYDTLTVYVISNSFPPPCASVMREMRNPFFRYH